PGSAGSRRLHRTDAGDRRLLLRRGTAGPAARTGHPGLGRQPRLAAHRRRDGRAADLRPGAWPGISLGAFAVILSLTTSPEPSALGLVAGSTAAPVCGYLMLRRVGFRTDLARLRDGLA